MKGRCCHGRYVHLHRTIGSASHRAALEDGAMRKGISNMISTAGRVGSARQSRCGPRCARSRSLLSHSNVCLGTPALRRRFAMTTSFGIQSAVPLHMLSRLPDGETVPVVWVDTGYLPMTYRYCAQTLCELSRSAFVVAQSAMSPARMEALHGRLWDTGREEDLETYHLIRKMEPLEEGLGATGGALLGQWRPSRPNRPSPHDEPAGFHPRSAFCVRCWTGPRRTSTTTCRTTIFPSILCSSRIFHRWGLAFQCSRRRSKWRSKHAVRRTEAGVRHPRASGGRGSDGRWHLTMEAQQNCLLIGNSRWHWAHRTPAGWCRFRCG